MEPTFLHCRGNVNTLTGAPMVLRNNKKSSGVSYLANSLVVKDDFQQQSLMSKQCAEYVFRFQAQFSKHIYFLNCTSIVSSFGAPEFTFFLFFGGGGRWFVLLDSQLYGRFYALQIIACFFIFWPVVVTCRILHIFLIPSSTQAQQSSYYVQIQTLTVRVMSS